MSDGDGGRAEVVVVVVEVDLSHQYSITFCHLTAEGQSDKMVNDMEV